MFQFFIFFRSLNLFNDPASRKTKTNGGEYLFSTIEFMRIFFSPQNGNNMFLTISFSIVHIGVDSILLTKKKNTKNTRVAYL